MASWHLAPALDLLRREVNAKWPGRSKTSDGTIGDPAHSSRTSDHNPNGRRSVNAIDITAKGISTATLIAAAKRHPSVRYIIFNRKIMNRDIGNWAARAYSGENPHTQHVHISIYQSATAETRTQSWGLATAKPEPTKPGTKAPKFPLPKGSYFGPKSGPNTSVSGYYSHRADLSRWQEQMRKRGWTIATDGLYGPKTAAVAKAFQREKGLGVDGKIGPETWAAAWTEKIT